MKKLLTTALCALFASSSYAYQSTDFVKVIELAPAIGGNVYITVDQPGAMCTTNVFILEVKDASSQAVYSTLLSAVALDKKVKLETWGACEINGGWGTKIQRITVPLI